MSIASPLLKIITYLKSRHWQYIYQPENQQIITGVKADNFKRLMIIIRSLEDGEYLEIEVPELIKGINPNPYKKILFQTLLSLTNETKMVRWEYDALTDQINAKIELPLEDAQLTQRQFDRCLEALIELVDQIAMPRLLAVMQTGKDPGEVELGERLLLKLQELLPEGYLNLLDQALTNRKNRGIFFQSA